MLFTGVPVTILFWFWSSAFLPMLRNAKVARFYMAKNRTFTILHTRLCGSSENLHEQDPKEPVFLPDMAHYI